MVTLVAVLNEIITQVLVQLKADNYVDASFVCVCGVVIQDIESLHRCSLYIQIILACI